MRYIIIILAIFSLCGNASADYCKAIDVDGAPLITETARHWKTLLPVYTLSNHPMAAEVAAVGAFEMTDAIPAYNPETERLSGPVATWTEGPSVTRTWTASRIPWAERVASKVKQIKTWCDAALATPVTSSALGEPHQYLSTGEYMTYILAGIISGQSMSLPVLIDGDNSMMVHNIQQIQTLFSDFSTAKAAAGAKQDILFAQAKGCAEDNDSCLAGVVWGNDSI